MDKLPLTSPYRTAAILAAFSRASDDAPRGLPPRSRTAGSLHRDSLRRAFARVMHGLLAGLMKRHARRWTIGNAATLKRRSRRAAVDDTLIDPSGAAPALASHFDLCHTADLDFELRPPAQERAA